MTAIELLSTLCGLASAVAVILTAVWVQQGFVLNKPATSTQVKATAIVAIVAGSLRVLLDDVYPIIERWSYYPAFFEFDITFLFYHAALIAAGVLLLCSAKKPHLARVALGVQTLVLLSLAVLYFSSTFAALSSFWVGNSNDMAQFIRVCIPPPLCTAGLAVYPAIVWFQSGKQR